MFFAYPNANAGVAIRSHLTQNAFGHLVEGEPLVAAVTDLLTGEDADLARTHQGSQ